jgi:cytochrome c biogenesis protein CcmG/thiol:disulfide interchange protein DsbE
VLTAVLGGAGIWANLSGPTGATVIDPLVDRTRQPAPVFALPELKDPRRHLSITAFRGRPLVVNFWASWCHPCRAEMPLLEAQYRADGGSVRFLGIDTNDTRGSALEFLAREHVTYPSLVLGNRASPLVRDYGLIGLPITAFISAGGTLMGRHIGQMNAATLRVALRLAFGPAAAGG